jgi:hypothetical protein
VHGTTTHSFTPATTHRYRLELIQREAATAGSTLPSRFIELWDRSAFQFGPSHLVAARIGCQWSWLPGKRPTVRNGRRRLAGC